MLGLAALAVLVAEAGERTVLRPADLEQAVRAFIAQRADGASGTMEVGFRSVPDSIVVVGRGVDLQVGTGQGARMRGPVAFAVTVIAEGRPAHRVMVTALLRTFDTVLVAERTIGRHDTPSAEDVRLVRCETTGMERAAIGGMEGLTAKRTRRAIARGSVLYADLFEEMPLVLQGTPVHVRVRSGNVSVTANGTACEDGRAGEMIEVTVQGRSGRLRARVEDGRTVAVQVD